MKYNKLFISALMLFLGLQFSAKAQTLEETLQDLSASAAQSYVSPIVSAFGSNMNSAWFKGVPDAVETQFDFEVKFGGIATLFSDNNKTFSTNGTFRFTSAQVDQILSNSGITSSNPIFNATKTEMLNQEFEVGISGPTLIGSKSENVTLDFPSQSINGQNILGYQVVLDGVNGFLSELSALPYGMAQINVGTLYGTELSLRYLPSVNIQDLGDFKLFGFGLMHNPNVWFEADLPVDLGLGFFTQTMDVGTIFSSTATQFGLFASKTFGKAVSVTPYFGLTSESSKTTVKYDYVFTTPTGPTTSSLELKLEGENNIGFTVGADFHLLFINVFVDYKKAAYNTISGGLSFDF